MYGRDEHVYYMNGLGDVNAALDNARDMLESLIGEVGNDFSGQARVENRVQSDSERATIATMSAARVMIGEAMQAIDRAVALLPPPPPPVAR